MNVRVCVWQELGPEPGAGCDFEPHPDYWVALLWKRLMGSTVLGAPTTTAAIESEPHVDGGTDQQALRLHAHCTAGATNGSVTVALSNAAEAVTFNLSFAGSPPLSGRRLE